MENTGSNVINDSELIQNSQKIVRFFVHKRGTKEYEENKTKIMEEWYDIIKYLSEKKSPSMQLLVTEPVFSTLRGFLVEKDRGLRLITLKIFRYLLDSPKAFEMIKTKQIYILIARALDREPKPEIFDENIQILKLVRKWIEVDAKSFPKLLANTLVSLSESSEDLMKKAVIENLRRLAIANPELAAWSGAIKVLIDSMVDPNTQEMSETLTLTLLLLVNDPSSRKAVRGHLDFKRIFSLFTDIDYPSESKDGKKDNQVRFENQLDLAKRAIMLMLKNWNGLIYLGYERSCLNSLVMALKQPVKPIIRNAVYDIIGEILAIGVKNLPKHSCDLQIQNLINYYLMFVVHLLMDCGLQDVLIELAGLEDSEISGLAQKYLKHLSYLNFTLLSTKQYNYPNYLISSTEITEPLLVELKSRSSEIVNKMGDYIFDSIYENRGEGGTSKFLNLCENLFLSTPLGMTKSKLFGETLSKIKFQLDNDLDDTKFNNLIKLSGVNAENDWKRWNWNEIGQITDMYLNNTGRMNEVLKNKFLTKLLFFYQPSKKAFVTLEWTSDNFKFAKVGYNILRVLLKYRDGKSLLQTTSSFLNTNKSFMVDMYNLLTVESGVVLDKKQSGNEIYTGMLSHDNFTQSMIREYISWIGLLTSTKFGTELLIESKIFEILFNIVQSKKKDYLIIHILFCLDYTTDKPREFLQFCLENGSDNIILSCLELLRLLYRSELSDFSQWGMDLLVTKLYSKAEIASLALNIIEEICQEKNYLTSFLQRWPKIDDLSKNGKNFLISLLKVKNGFEYLTDANRWTYDEMKYWVEKGNEEYVERVEKCLYNALDCTILEEQANCFKYSESLTSWSNNSVNLGLIYRLPWNMNLIYEGDGYSQLLLDLTMEYDPENNMVTLKGKPQGIEVFKKLTFKAGSMFVLKFNMSIGKVYIDTMCKEVGSPLNIKCDGTDLNNLGKRTNADIRVSKNGVTFVFTPIDGNFLRLEFIQLDLKLDNISPNDSKMPPHLFGELVKTTKGVDLLKESGYLKLFKEELLKDDTSTLKRKRAILWCLGHIGSSKKGVLILIEQQIIPMLVNMAEKSECLSLRGTCSYILNLIANTVEGSQELEKCNWMTYRNGVNMKICFPKTMKQFYNINDFSLDAIKTQWAVQTKWWDEYERCLEKMDLNDEKKEVLKHVAGLGSAMLKNTSLKELKKISNKNPELFTDTTLMNAVVLMMTYYKFKTLMRRQIHLLFDKIVSTNSIYLLDKVDTFLI